MIISYFSINYYDRNGIKHQIKKTHRVPVLFKNQLSDLFVILAISIRNRVGTAVLPDSYALITE